MYFPKGKKILYGLGEKAQYYIKKIETALFFSVI